MVSLRPASSVCVCRQEPSLCLSGPQLLQCDLQAALEGLQGSQAHAVGAPRIPTVHWHDVGGLGDAKRLLTDTLQLPLQHPQLLEAGLKRSGESVPPTRQGLFLFSPKVIISESPQCCLARFSIAASASRGVLQRARR